MLKQFSRIKIYSIPVFRFSTNPLNPSDPEAPTIPQFAVLSGANKKTLAPI